MDTDFAKAFRIIRAAFGIQQAELAAILDISASQLSLIEKGRRQPSFRVIGNLAAATGVPTTLITLLASDPKEIESHELSDLASALLKLLVSASDGPQRSLPLGRR